MNNKIVPAENPCIRYNDRGFTLGHGLFETILVKKSAITANTKKVIIATHVPPVPECCWHQDHPSDENWLPYFASKATGDVIVDIAQKHKDIHFLVLCGHTHTAAAVKFFDNLEIKAGGTQYYKPEVQEVILV